MPSGPLSPDIVEAARTGHISTMRRWCGSDACDINAKTPALEGVAGDSTALHLAAAFGHGEVVLDPDNNDIVYAVHKSGGLLKKVLILRTQMGSKEIVFSILCNPFTLFFSYLLV